MFDFLVKYLIVFFIYVNCFGVKFNFCDFNFLKIVCIVLIFGFVGVVYFVNEFFIKWIVNNWMCNKFGEWKIFDKEIVFIIGVSSGIGEYIVKMLLVWYKGVKIVIVDFVFMFWELFVVDVFWVFYF